MESTEKCDVVIQHFNGKFLKTPPGVPGRIDNWMLLCTTTTQCCIGKTLQRSTDQIPTAQSAPCVLASLGNAFDLIPCRERLGSLTHSNTTVTYWLFLLSNKCVYVHLQADKADKVQISFTHFHTNKVEHVTCKTDQKMYTDLVISLSDIVVIYSSLSHSPVLNTALMVRHQYH